MVIAGRRPQFKLFFVIRNIRVEGNVAYWQTELVLVVSDLCRVVRRHAAEDQIILVQEDVSSLGAIPE